MQDNTTQEIELLKEIVKLIREDETGRGANHLTMFEGMLTQAEAHLAYLKSRRLGRPAQRVPADPARK